MKVLIVEDEIIISEDIAGMLESQSYEVTDQVIDYDEAVLSLRDNPPDLVLIDINLAGAKDGIDLAHTINQTNKVPFMYTSSLSDPATIARAKKTQPATYLVKPFQDEQLFAAIEMAMSNFVNQDVTNDSPHGPEERLPIFNNSIFIKDGHRFKKLALDDIIYVQKSHNYLEIYAENSKHLIRVSMNYFIDQIEQEQLFRVHKSYAVNPNKITEVLPTMVRLGQVDVPLSRSYTEELKKHLRIF